MSEPRTPNRLQELLDEKDVSAAAVADHLGLSEVQVVRWAKNKVLIPSKHIEPLAVFLDVEPAVLMGWDRPRAAA